MIEFFKINIEYQTIVLNRIDKFKHEKKYLKELNWLNNFKEQSRKYDLIHAL